MLKMNTNEKLVAHYMISKGAFPGKPGVHRSSITADLDMARSTVYDTLVRLERRKIVYRHTRDNGKIGRGFVFWRLTQEEF